MKRTNVVVDEVLLENARRAIGERTYSATITAALEEVVRKDRLKKALDAFQQEAGKGDFFWPGYLQEIRPDAYSMQSDLPPTGEEKKMRSRTARPKRAAAFEKRTSVTKSTRRGSR
jgi:hypothetical protein